MTPDSLLKLNNIKFSASGIRTIWLIIITDNRVELRDTVSTLLSKHKIKYRLSNTSKSTFKYIEIIDKIEGKLYKIRFKTKNVNSLGKQFARIAESTTILSLKKDIKTPKDTNQDLFIKNKELFERWLPTFQLTRKAILSATGINNFNAYDILYADDKDVLLTEIDKTLKTTGMKRSLWTPADIYIIKKSKKASIIKSISCCNSLSALNSLIYDYYLSKSLFPISLKQITNKIANFKKYNEVGKVDQISTGNISINKFNLDFSMNTKEIGQFRFENTNGNKIIMQCRQRPFGYRTTQLEVLSDGTKSGGRIATVPTEVIDYVLHKFNGAPRISNITKYFGSSAFSDFGIDKLAKADEQYDMVRKHSAISAKDSPVDFEKYLRQLLTLAKTDYDTAGKLSAKIQGLQLMHFFISNIDNVSEIANELLLGAKRISPNSGFYIKIF